MKNYLKHQKVVARRKPLSNRVKVAIAAGVISLAATTGIVSYVNEYRHPSTTHISNDSPFESILEKRARQLDIANTQLMNAQTPEEINGLSAVVTDIQSGAYDY